jgi:hypothetical protein
VSNISIEEIILSDKNSIDISQAEAAPPEYVEILLRKIDTFDIRLFDKKRIGS